VALRVLFGQALKPTSHDKPRPKHVSSELRRMCMSLLQSSNLASPSVGQLITRLEWLDHIE
jgi:hypothetical protein